LPTGVPGYIVLENPTSFTRTLLNGRANHMVIDSLAQTITRKGRVSPPSSEWWVALTSNTDTPMPDFNNLVMDPDEVVRNTSSQILIKEKPTFYRQTISGPNGDLWHSVCEAEMDNHWHNYT
jgi:hypothetical protein